MIQEISVAIVDDHRLVRHGLKRILGTFSRISSVYEAANGKELLKLAAVARIDVVLLDLHMPVMSGEDACICLQNEFPQIKIIVLSMEDSNKWVEFMLRLGVHGYLTKNAEVTEVEEAIYAVMDKGFYFNDLVVKIFQKNPLVKASPESLLTEREQEIVQHICDEFTMKQIAEHLNISEKTVQNHRSNIMQKLSVSNTAGLVKWAISNHVVDLNIV